MKEELRNYKMVAEIIINRTAKKLNQTFDYNVPKELEDLVVIGSKVLVPFGRGKTLTEGFVVGFKEKSEYEIKDIVKLEENLTDFQIKLARWMAKKYFCNVSDCIKLMLTPGTRTENKEKRIKDKIVNTIYLKKSVEEIEFEIETEKIKSEKHKKILNFVKDNEGATIPEIEIFTDCSRAIINTLIKNDYLEVVEQKAERNPLLYKDVEKIREKESSSKLELTEEQKEAYKNVENVIEEKRYQQFLLYGVTGSRKNRSLFTINTKSIGKRKISDCISTRNIINTTDAR